MSLKLLWELQELDLSINALSERIEHNPLRQEVEDTAEYLTRAEKDLQQAEHKLGEQRKRLKRGELDLEAITAEYRELHQRLYSGEVKNVKELEQMEVKLRLVKQNQSSLEERLLGLMESIEVQEEQVQNLAGQKDEAVAENRERRQLLDGELARLEDERKELQNQRDLLSSRTEPEHLELYRDLVRRHQGRGVARVINDICQGCSVFISAAQRGFLYDPRALIYCENCGRLLVRFAGEETRTQVE